MRLWKDTYRSDKEEIAFKGKPYFYDVISSGWKVDRIRAYDPCVFFTAFSSKAVLGQLYLSLKSLTTFANFTGHIHILTDQTYEEILRNVPELDPSKLTIQTVMAKDFTGFVGSKYLLSDFEFDTGFQPLLFSDPDIIFDRTIDAMLVAVTANGTAAGPLEDISLLRHNPAVGATLLQGDNIQPREARGFNGGSICFINTHENFELINTIRTIIISYNMLHGRGSLGWVDQEVANYVGYKSRQINTSVMSQFVRYGIKGMERDPSGRVGLVHFWPPGSSQAKLDAMQIYFDGLTSLRNAFLANPEISF